ncbi:MAG: hypothetical protein IID33_10395 [Planctomycetes bacterium]|nr:hypothetical protein [Planctomycetota bacterium]
MSTSNNRFLWPTDTGLLLVGHGSREPSGACEFLVTARPVAAIAGRLTVEPRRRRRAKRLSIELAWTAHGDCETNGRVVRTWQEKEIPELPDGSRYEREFEFDIPPNAPITHAGYLFQIHWCVHVRTWGNWLTGTVSAAASIVVTPICDPDGRPPFKRGTPAVRPAR